MRPGAWSTVTLPLRRFAGRTVAAVVLRVSARTATDYRLHVGELALLPAGSSPTPATPTDFTVECAHPDAGRTTAELVLSWNFQGKGVWYYDLWRVRRDGSPEPLGRVYDGVYYVKSLSREGTEATSTVSLVAVAPDGTRSAAATAKVDWR